MSMMTQILLFASYAILGIAVMVLPPRLFGASEQLSQLFGVIIFFGAWQVQNWLTVRRIERDTSARVAVLEDVTTILRGDLERARRLTKKGDEKSDVLVSELKVLHTLLTQVMEHEVDLKKAPPSDGGKLKGTDEEAKLLGVDDVPSDKSEPAPGEEETPQAEAAEDVESADEAEGADADVGADLADDLGLTPEEAAMAVVDEGEDGDLVVDDAAADGEAGAPVASGDAAPTPKRRQTGPRKKAPIRLIKREDQLLSVIRSSLAENRVDLYLQPIVALPARKTVHYECFSRVRDEEGRIILPRQYMKVAESKGLIGTIDNLLLFRLIQLVRRLGKRRPRVRFFCNMSRYSIQDEEFFPQFIDFMTANQEFRDRLVFEISQDDWLALEGDEKDRLLQLGRKGFGYSMDLVKDFNQDFALLGERKFQFIKSDLSDLLTSHPEEGDVEAMKSFVRRHGMQLIASRIESEDMVLQALEARCEYAQGYLFGEPTSSSMMNNEF